MGHIERCLIIVGSLGRGGAEKQAVLTAHALRLVGADARLAVLGGPTTIKPDADARGIPVSVIRPGTRMAPQVWALRKIIVDFQPSCVVTFLFSAGWRYLLARSTLPHAPVWLMAERGNAKFSEIVTSPARYALRQKCYAAADLVLVNSSALAGNVLAQAPNVGRRLVVIPNAAVVTTASSPRNIRDLVPEAARFKPLIGAIGSFQPDRNYELLADAFATFIKSNPDAGLLVIGRRTGSDCGECGVVFDRRLKFHGIERSVRCAGEIPDASTLIGQMDLFVTASRLEGSSNALAEALIAGAPIATVPVADAVELVKDAAVVSMGWTAPAVATAMSDALTKNHDLRRLAAIRGKELLAERSLERLGKVWMDAMEQAVDARAATGP